MAANAQDKFVYVGRGTATTLSSPGYTAGGTSINVASTTNWPTASGVIFAMDEIELVNGEWVRVDGTFNSYQGTVASATQIDNVDHLSGDGDRNYSAGATTRVYILVDKDRENRMVDGILVEHNQDGTHGDITATSVTTTGDITVGGTLTITGSASAEGWSALGSTLTYSSNDGNKQATYTITGVDKTGTIQEGMKVKLPRPTTVGTQCTDLEASSSQYASKSSPSGITFTDDFTCGAWVKVESNPNASNYIIARISGGSGFVLNTQQDGTLRILGGNAGNLDYAISYQTLPTGKWVHVAATLNMSASTATMYINGVAVSTAYTNGSGTAIVQAGDLTIGSASGGGSYFDGKIKHAFVADKVLSAAEVKEAMVSDNLTSASFSSNLDAYFKLEGDFTDSSANSNDLTASGGAVATDTDSPFSSTEYGIITSATFSTDTTVTVFTGDGVAPNENITAPAYSTHRVPYGFPASRDKWKVESLFKSNFTQTSPVNGTWYNLTTTSGTTGGMILTVPTGSWNCGYQASVRSGRAGSSNGLGVNLTLSTTASTESDADFTTQTYLAVNSAVDGSIGSLLSKNKGLDTQALTAYYLNASPTNASITNIQIRGDQAPAIIYAECAYL